MKVGVQTLAPEIFGGAPDIVVSGFNVGGRLFSCIYNRFGAHYLAIGNTGLQTVFSGTVGAASAAADQLSIPGIAFSGATGDQTAWNVNPVSDYVFLYSYLAMNLTTTLTSIGKPYLPPNVWLNVNFPPAGSGTSCTNSNQFKYVLSRIHSAVPILTPKDINICNNTGYLPTESSVIGTSGCYVSVSVGWANTKLDASASAQLVVLNALQTLLSCLPGPSPSLQGEKLGIQQVLKN